MTALERGRRHQPVADQPAATQLHADVPATVAFVVPEPGEQVPEAAGRVIAPAVLVERAGGDVAVPAFAETRTVAEVELPAAEAAGLHLRPPSRRGESGVGGEGERAAQRVEPEGRVGAGHQRQGVHGELGDHVPIHDVPEWLVHTHAVEVHRHPLR
jgi:hypothetical protein